MNRRLSLLEKIEKCQFSIPVEGKKKGRSEIYVEVGEGVKKGDPIFYSNKNKIVQSYSLTEMLNIRPQDSRDYIGRVGGEYVEKGDLLAEKVATAGLVTKRVIAGVDGIVSTDRLEQGYLDILAESQKGDFESKVDGKVVEVMLNVGVVVESSAYVLNYIAAKNIAASKHNFRKEIFGELTIVGDGLSVYHEKDLEEDYSGKVVFAGRYLYPEVLSALYKAGAKAVVTYSMDYMDYWNCSVPVVVLGGFGQLKMHKALVESITQWQDKWCVVNEQDGMLKLLGNPEKYNVANKVGNGDFFVAEIKTGMQVKIVEPGLFGVVGEVAEDAPEADSGDENYCLVKSSDNKGILVKKENLHVIG